MPIAEELTVNEIDEGVVALVDLLGLPAGSGGGINLYELLHGYLQGIFPPGHLVDLDGAVAVAGNYLFAPAAACRALRELDVADADGDGVTAACGIAQAVNPFYPLGPREPPGRQRHRAHQLHLQ